MTASLFLAALLACPASAGVTVSSAAVQVSITAKKGSPVFHTIESLFLPPDGKPAAVLRAALTVDNEGPRVESGVVIRFAISARVKRVGSEGEGTWSVPFLLEERHVPRVARGRGVTVTLPVNRVALVGHLKKLRAAGLWPDALRIEALIEPRRGEDLVGRLVSKTIAVDWKPAPARSPQTAAP